MTYHSTHTLLPGIVQQTILENKRLKEIVAELLEWDGEIISECDNQDMENLYNCGLILEESEDDDFDVLNPKYDSRNMYRALSDLLLFGETPLLQDHMMERRSICMPHGSFEEGVLDHFNTEYIFVFREESQDNPLPITQINIPYGALHTMDESTLWIEKEAIIEDSVIFPGGDKHDQRHYDRWSEFLDNPTTVRDILGPVKDDAA